MSYTTVYAIDVEGWVKEVGKAHCAPAFFPCVWEYLGVKYNVPDESVFGRGEGRAYYAEKTIRNVWALQHDKRLSGNERLLLLATFDRGWVRRDAVPFLLAAIAEFWDYWGKPHGIRPCAKECAELISAHLLKDPHAMGFCFNGTSVVDSMWKKAIPLGKDGKPLTGNGVADDYDYQPLNILQHKLCSDGGEHWEVKLEAT